MEHRRGHHENRRVDEERRHQRDRGIDRRVADRFGLARRRVGVLPRLHDRGVQIEVVRHHRGAEDADGDVQHLRVAQDAAARDEAGGDRGEIGAREPHLDGERPGDGQDEPDDERFDVAEAAVLQEEDDEDVERRQRDAPRERHVKEEVERDGGADDFGEVARRDGDLAEHPEDDRDRTRVAVAARLRQVASAGDAEAGGERLQQDRHQVRQHDHAEERVAVARATGQVGCPIPGVHVADGHQIPGAGKGEELPPEPRARGDVDRSVNFRKADAAGRKTPAAGRGRLGFASHVGDFDYSKS